MNAQKGKDLSSPNEEASSKRQLLAENPQIILQFEEILTLRQNLSSTLEKRNEAMEKLNTDSTQLLQHELNCRELNEDHSDECNLLSSIIREKIFIENELSRMRDEIKLMESKHVSLSDANDSLEVDEETQRRFVELRKKYDEAEEIHSKLLEEDAKASAMYFIKFSRFKVAAEACTELVSQVKANQGEIKALHKELDELCKKLSSKIENLKVLVDSYP